MLFQEQTTLLTSINKEVKSVTIRNRKHVEITITNYGGIITSIKTPDKNGNFNEIVLGFDDLNSYTSENYKKNCPYLGAIIGRYANRIKEGQFNLDGKNYQLACNNGPNHLHGGPEGFHQKIWDMEVFTQKDRSGVILTTTSTHLEEGYPGNLKVEVTYTLTDENELVIDYNATTDQTTIINLTNHSYFNLSGCKTDILNHDIVIYANTFTPKDGNDIPTGEIVEVNDSPMDFTTPQKLGNRIDDVEGKGYDHNFVINGVENELNPAARVVDAKSGRLLEFYTTEPGFQLYTGNYLDGSFKRNEQPFDTHFGFCLEAQHYPDSPNQPNFPSTELVPGETYTQTTVYKFGIVRNQ
ncbi:MAG: galactose mutarotase [Marinilabiliaceae bacterium]|nr:galactose mutarotase [Marinilabiliaceae bacterium]